jgi:hypothetical protein
MTVPPVALEDPRGALVAALTDRVEAALGALAGHYAATSRAAEGELRTALEGLAEAKQAQLGLLRAAGLAGTAGGSPAPPVPSAAPPRWGVLLGKAFEGERALESAAGELARLPLARTLAVAGARIAAAAARDQETVRRLYLRYS